MLRPHFGIVLSILLMSLNSAFAQQGRFDPRGRGFERAKPAVGDDLPDVTVYDSDGKEFRLKSLRGEYVVLSFGCLT